ncbi:MAG: aldehyde ferredoxin oxidoreductase N-terminal domain-containing protein [Chloroflexota bacterium]|nr:aldehyde ferredoxin oxidoreductase N-terminal domain-containing protein [Chloroflexota bacterium]
MKPIMKTVERFASMRAWANRILRIDLSNMRISVQETEPYVPEFLGARGIAARICWEEHSEPVEPFDPANPLMIFPGALTGSPSPYAGRTVVCTFSPQAYPHPWFTRSSVGGYFGGALKRAGYDGIVVTGDSETPVRVHIRDDEVSILPADDLWGLDTMDSLEAIESAEGKEVRSLVIGPAGERLSRIATIHAAHSSACGLGGFGAVMGAKKLKAISVIGSGRVSLARPKTVTSIARTLVRMMAEDGQTGPLNFYGDIAQLNQQLAEEGNGRARCHACTESCVTPCAAYFSDVPGVVYDRKWSGDWVCVGTRFQGFDEDEPSHYRAIYDWQLARRPAFEMNVLSNRYGLSQSDIITGMVPWLIACQKAGLIFDINGLPMDWSSPPFWAEFLHAIAYREGLGDVLAEGGWAAARNLHLGEDLAQDRYPGWGHHSHCDGREGANVTFPFWLVSALQWMADTRDPFNSGHGYLWAAGAAGRAAGLNTAAERDAALDQIRAIGQHVYQSPDAVDPTSGYNGKAYPGYYQTLRSVVKDCVPVDAHFPLIYRENAPDRYWQLCDIEEIGEIEGPSIEYHLFIAGTGVAWSEEEFEQAAGRVCTMERALQVRYWARDREVDEMVLPYFEHTELHQSPFLEKRHGLDREQFKPVVNEFYALHGWDPKTGWPTHERLRALDMEDVYEPMLDGAAKARVQPTQV